MSTLVGKPAPLFNANAVVNGEVVNDFSLTRYLGKQHVVLFFYPKDFTFVCPSELHAFQAALKDFESRGSAVVACSTDTEQSHWGWLQVPKNQGGIGGVTYPIVADTNKTIASAYGVLVGELVPGATPDAPFTAKGDLIAYRGLFLIDRKGIVRHALVNDLPLGRDVAETLRIVDALQFFEKHGEVCPANWTPGKSGMKATNKGVAEYLAKN